MRPTKREVFGGGESAEEGEAFGHDANLAFERDRVRGKIVTKNLDAAGGRREQASEHLDGGGFAGAVGTEEAKELAGRHGQVDIADGGKGAEPAGKSSKV